MRILSKLPIEWGRVLLFGLFIIVAHGQAKADSWEHVQRVNDGDTVTLSNGRHLRYLGIDTPEIDYKRHRAQPFAYAARRFNRKMVGGQKVRIEFGKKRTDRFGRLLAYVFLEDATFVNRQLIEKGYAYFLPSKQPGRYDDILLKAQRNAISGEKGIWNKWREPDGRSVYIGNRRSRRFHRVECPNAKKMSRKNRIRFTSMHKAFNKGYAPAKRCMGDWLGWRKP